MKTIFNLSVLFFLLLALPAKAQSDDRNKIKMVITHQGKSITTDLSNVGLGITRYKDYAVDPSTTTTTATKEKTVALGNYYLTMNIKKLSKELLKLLAQKQAGFNGVITITDSYGKNPSREIKFTNATMENYSDQFSTQSYDDAYSSTAISLSAKNITIDGIEME